MATTNEISAINEVLDSATHKLKSLPSVIVDTYCWFRGFVQVTGKQVALADSLAYYVDDEQEDALQLEEVSEEVLDEDGSLIERRVRRARKAPFVSWLVQYVRGRHLSQCQDNEANRLVFERHARSIMEEHNVRPTDAARVIPLATATFFHHRSVDQIDAAAIIHAPSFKTSMRKYNAKYYCNGRVAATQQRA